ncbi:MAG: prepilin-type N-terminal cleavage/methylation domain-containing protein [Armatimonadetes bacterium]|nr:prepilin-type N-terminal cleavage/methylation domain-containing protein [Armatimonadota bacterium]
MKRHTQSAFTLVELLVVIAITAILITIVAIPLLQGFRFTQTGLAFAEAQQSARQVVERIGMELSRAAAVMDNSAPAAGIQVELPLRRVDGSPFDRRYGSVLIHNAKIDILPASKGDPGSPQFNPGRNRIDPTLKAPIGQINVPVSPGQALVRYWIGLRSPFTPPSVAGHYVNPWRPILVGADGTQPGPVDENLYVLYRAEIVPWIWDADLGTLVPNPEFFAIDPLTGEIVIDDPGFFVWDRTAAEIPDGDVNAHHLRLANWKAVSTVVVRQRRTDLIIPEIDEATGDAIYDPYPLDPVYEIPRVRSLIIFQPVRVNNEPATSNDVFRSGVEVIDNEGSVAPEYFQTEMASWTKNSLVRFFRADPRTSSPYYLGRWRQPTGASFTENFKLELVWFDPTIDLDEFNDGAIYFDLSRYMEAADAAGPVFIGDYMGLSGPVLSAPELLLFRLDTDRGRILTDFPVEHALGFTPALTTSVVNANLVDWVTSSTAATYDPTGELGRRFVDLRGLSPLTANTFNPLGTFAFSFPLRASRIVPGSEEVIGPDQRPGPNFGRPVRYSRVAPGQEAGLNQYKINYTDIPEPSDYMTFLGVPDPGSNSDVRRYIQPRFKKGYIELYSDPTLPLPVGNIRVTYDFQLNEPGDIVTVDYNSAQQIQVELTLLRFPSTSHPAPQSVTMKEVVTVRNLQR